jgi:hypothetical protein
LSEDKLILERSKGQRAQELLNNEIYQETFTLLKQRILEEFETSPQRDVEGRERLHMMLYVLRAFQLNIKTIAETGKLAELQLEAEFQKDKKKPKSSRF